MTRAPQHGTFVLWLGALGALGALALAASGCAEHGGALDPASDQAEDMHALFWVMVVIGTAVLVGVLVLAGIAVTGARADGTPPNPRRSSRLVIGGGVVLPVVVLVPLAVWMVDVAYRVEHPERADPLEVRVIGHQFWWEIIYPDAAAVTANELHIPAGRAVRVELESIDVIHSFWVPRLAGKIDMVPGRTNTLWLEAREPGRYPGLCAEFCGIQHATMRFEVVAQPAEEFDDWLAREAAEPGVPSTPQSRRGQQVFAAVGCAACHSVRGWFVGETPAPDLTHVASRSTLGAGTISNDRGNLAGWIVDPWGVKPGVLMPPTPLDADELLDLLAYLEELE